MNWQYIIGIDPGSKGFLAAHDLVNDTWTHLPIDGSSEADIANFIKVFRPAKTLIIMEEVHAIFGSSAKATFSFGTIFGFLRGLIVAFGMPYVLVPPKKWQAEMWDNCDKVKEGDKINTKKTSIKTAHRIFPNLDFRKTEKCKNIDDNKVDATLICEYARRKNL